VELCHRRCRCHVRTSARGPQKTDDGGDHRQRRSRCGPGPDRRRV